MSLVSAACPIATALTQPDAVTCYEYVGEVQKLLIQRTYSTGTTLNTITIADDNPNVLATWTALKAASDGTKVISTPAIDEFVFPEAAVREYGGAGVTRGGIVIVLGNSGGVVTGKFLMLPQDIYRQLDALSGEPNLSVFLINEIGAIYGLKNAATATTFRGIPVNNFTVLPKILGGFSAPDHNPMRFSLFPDWSKWLHKVTPTDFDALLQL